MVGGRDQREHQSSAARRWAAYAAAVLFWLIVWQLASMALGSRILLAGPLDVCVALAADVASASFWSIVAFSFLRIVAGFFCAFVAGIFIAASAHRFSAVRTLLAPVVSLMKSVPIVCIIVLLLIVAGSAQVPFIAVFLMAFPAFYFSVLEALAHLDMKMREMLDVFGVSRLKRLFVFYGPSVLPFVRATSKVAVGMSWKAGIAAELIGIPLGSIGEQLYRSKITLDTADLFAWTLVVVAVSVLCEKAFIALLDRLPLWNLRWSRRVGLRHHRPDAASHDIELRQATKAFDGKQVLADVTLRIPAGARVCLSDPSGRGKTTLISALVGLVPLDGGDITGVGSVGMVFQEARLFEGRSAIDNVSLVGGGAPDVAREMLAELLPADALDAPVSQLSGGMRRRVELCRALAVPAQTIVLDEPFTGLDRKSRARVYEFVDAHLGAHTLILVSHDEKDAEALGAARISLDTSV
jgi:NitT/TauT family transport system permease protein